MPFTDTFTEDPDSLNPETNDAEISAEREGQMTVMNLTTSDDEDLSTVTL